MPSFLEKQEAGLSSAVTALDMSVDLPASIWEGELSVFQEPEVSFKTPEDTKTLSSEEQEKTAQTIPDAIQYHDVGFLEFDKTSKKVIYEMHSGQKWSDWVKSIFKIVKGLLFPHKINQWINDGLKESWEMVVEKEYSTPGLFIFLEERQPFVFIVCYFLKLAISLC